MTMPSVTSSASSNSQQQQQQQPSTSQHSTMVVSKQVQFAPMVSQIFLKCHPLDDESDKEEGFCSLWYTKEQMHGQAKADVDAMLQECKASTTSIHSNSSMLVKPTAEQHQQPVERRGLEMYLPGQLVRRQQRRRMYQEAVLQRRECLMTLCNAAVASEVEDAAERLRKFSLARSQGCRDEALTLGSRDAQEAEVIYNEVTSNDGSDKLLDQLQPQLELELELPSPSSSKDTVTSQSNHSHTTPSKQMQQAQKQQVQALTTMLSQNQTLLRVE